MNKEQVVLAACARLIEHFSALLICKASIGYGFHSRIFSHYLHPEKEFVYAGTSRNIQPDTKVRLEHIVPCIVLINECTRLISEGSVPHSRIAELLAKHWKVAHITKDEQNKLDKTLKLKSKMPQGWTFKNGDTYARFQLAEISLHPCEDFINP